MQIRDEKQRSPKGIASGAHLDSAVHAPEAVHSNYPQGYGGLLNFNILTFYSKQHLV